MSNNREILKQLARGENLLNGEYTGFDIELWGYIDSGQYNERAVKACLGLLRWYKGEFGVLDRSSGFYEYIRQLNKEGYDIKI